MGGLRTERTMAYLRSAPAEVQALIDTLETPNFTGLVIDALYRSPELMALSGQAFIGAELGQELGVKDINGKQAGVYAGSVGMPSDAAS
jgi:hypothetical protein